MSNLVNSPLWVYPTTLDDWPVIWVTNPALHYHLPIRQGWQSHPLVNQTPLEIEHIFPGQYAVEGLFVSFLAQAHPEHSLRNWLEAFLHLTGFPILAMQQSGQSSPQLLEWQYQGNSPVYAEYLAVDEVHLYEGLALLPDVPDQLARLYIVLARRDHWAWKVSLSLLSSCLPGMADFLVDSSDRLRAGATFGHLRFL